MNLIKRIYKNLKFRIKIFKSCPDYINEKIRYGLILAFKPYLNLTMWVTTKNGAKIYLGQDEIDEFILKDLCTDTIGRYFPHYLDLKTGDIVLDIGAHHGLYAMELNSHFPGIKIFCIEPDPDGLNIIKKHTKKNKANVNIIPFAIGAEEKTAFLVDNNDGSWGKTVEIDKINDAIKVNVETLKKILVNVNLNNIKLIKSNCEGGEFDLIPQIIELGIKPNLIVLMIHPDKGNVKFLINSLEDYGYITKSIWDSEINPCWHFLLDNKSRN